MAANLETEIVIDAPVERVWPVVSDLRRMGEWSPQCRKVLARGPVRPGMLMVNVNRDGWKVWPTRTKVVDFSHEQRVAFKVLDNQSVWSFTLIPDGNCTKVVQRRDVPERGTTKISQFLVDKALGGEADFEANLVAGMNRTLKRIKAEIEGAA